MALSHFSVAAVPAPYPLAVGAGARLRPSSAAGRGGGRLVLTWDSLADLGPSGLLLRVGQSAGAGLTFRPHVEKLLRGAILRATKHTLWTDSNFRL